MIKYAYIVPLVMGSDLSCRPYNILGWGVSSYVCVYRDGPWDPITDRLHMRSLYESQRIRLIFIRNHRRQFYGTW